MLVQGKEKRYAQKEIRLADNLGYTEINPYTALNRKCHGYKVNFVIYRSELWN